MEKVQVICVRVRLRVEGWKLQEKERKKLKDEEVEETEEENGEVDASYCDRDPPAQSGYRECWGHESCPDTPTGNTNATTSIIGRWLLNLLHQTRV